MMRALFSGVTGLRSHQTKMDVIGNNIANVNTVGYKKNTVTFKDLYNETISAAAASSGAGQTGTGGVNAKQIGLGSSVDSVTAVHTPGSAQYTGNGMDVAISGDGYFTVMSATGLQYTRAGNFYTDLQGNLVTSQGYYVQTVAPTVTVGEELSVDSVATNNLINQPSGILDAAHTGTVTADLTMVKDAEYGFTYEPKADNPWSVALGEGTGTEYVLDTSNVGLSGTLDVSAIQEEVRLLATNNGGAKAGNHDISFELDSADDDKLWLKFGDLKVASADLSGIADDPIPPNGGPYTISFIGAVSGNTMQTGGTTISYTNPSTTSSVTRTQLSEGVFGRLSRKPNMTLQEEGQWFLTRNNTNVEPVTFSYTAKADGGISGDVMFNTAQYGSVLLNVENGKINNMSDLNAALQSKTFKVNVRAENVPQYTPPLGVMAGDLKNLTINFDNYANMTIDAKGAVIAQLKSDMQAEIDGKTVEMKAGDKVVLGYVAMATFNNPTGLQKVGDNLFTVSANSGEPSYGMPGDGTKGSLSPSNLEMSNVDLSEEMVNMIITQRGFQANSRIITTTDTMLEELVNLKR